MTDSKSIFKVHAFLQFAKLIEMLNACKYKSEYNNYKVLQKINARDNLIMNA